MWHTWNPRSSRVAALALLAALSFPACRPPPQTPSIVVISIDTLRADHLSAYGYHRATPNIDALAAAGSRYADAHASAPWTLPSHMSLLTGRFASTHGVVDDTDVLPAEIPTLAEALERRGYRTGAFVSHHYLDARYGFARGFGNDYSYRQYENEPADPSGDVRGDDTVARATRYLDAHADDHRSYLLFVHLFDPHWNYRAPAPFAGLYTDADADDEAGTVDSINAVIEQLETKSLPEADLQHLIDLYDEEIAFADALVGQLVAKIRALPGGERTVIVLTSDHGEEFLDHGSLGHAVTLYREQSHVPLIVVEPDDIGTAGRIVEETVRSVDVAPTLARIADVPADDPFWSGIEGRPLQSASPAGVDREPRPVIFETTRWGPPRAAVSLRGRKAIEPMSYAWIGYRAVEGTVGGYALRRWDRNLEIFDIERDPREQSLLPTSAAADALDLLDRLRERSWRGARIDLRFAQPGSVTVQLPEGVRFRDEASFGDEVVARTIRFESGRLRLDGLPAGRQLTLGLPIDRAAQLHLTVHSGDATYELGSSRIHVAAGVAQEIDLGNPPHDPGDAPLPETGNQVRVRIRSLPAAEPLGLGAEVRRMLERLGYAEKDLSQ